MIALFIASCGWNNLPYQDFTSVDAPLWNAANAVATDDGLYVALPHAGALMRVPQSGEPARVDVGAGTVTRIAGAPDGQTVIAFVERSVCTAQRLRDCERDETLVEVRTDVTLVRDGVAEAPQEIDGAFNAVSFSDDGRFAVAHLDFTQQFELDGVVNLTSVAVVDLAENTTSVVPIGFAVDQVLFVDDGAGVAERAVALSRNAVAEIDLGASPPAVVATFPLTLDPDTQRDPSGVDLTPDGRYALISTSSSADLYAIDLVNKSINLIDLSSVPATLRVDQMADRTVLVFGQRAVVEVMDHDLFEVDTVVLDEPMNQVETIGGTALLWSNGAAHDLYRLSLDSNALVEYRLQNPAVSVHVAPTNEFAIALTRAEGGSGGGVDAIYDGHPGMEIVDLNDDDSEPFLLEGQGLGVQFSSDGTNLNALVLQEGVDYVFRYDLYARQASEIALSAPPVAIGAMPDGTFWITHTSALGLVSFLDPVSGEITEVAGFAAQGILESPELTQEMAQ